MQKHNFYNDFWSEVGGAFVTIAVWVGILSLLGLVLGMFTSCSPRITPIERVTTDTIYISKQLHDSIHVKDSIYFKEYIQNDTVYLTKYKYKEYWREKEVHDTLYQSHVDTLTVKVIEYKQTTKQQIFSEIGRLFAWLAFGLLLWGAVWILVKYKGKTNL